MVKCSAPLCGNSSYKKAPDITFHRFPKEEKLKKAWLLSMKKKNWEPKTSSVLCSKHFESHLLDHSGFRTMLAPSAIPKIFDSLPVQNEIVAMTEAKTQMQNTDEENASSIECRACLQILNKDSVLYNIFEEWTPPWDGMGESLAKDLAKLANIQISETDRHSKIICETCCQLLLSACSFTALVKNNDQILRQRHLGDTTGLDSLNDRVWPKPIQVDKSLTTALYENPMDVEIKQEVVSEDEYPTINGTYDTPKEEIPNLDIVKVEPEEMIQQQPLQIQITVNGSLPISDLHNELSHVTNGINDNGDDHLVTIKEEPLSEEDDTDPIASDLPLECMLCAKPFNSVTGLKAHVIAQHSYKSVKRKNSNSLSPEKKKCKYICAICRRTFTTSTDLMVHETCHNKSVCYGCNENFDTFVQLTAHRRTCKAISSKEVTKLKTLDDVKRPPQIKEQIYNLKCASCDETFTDDYYLSIHREIHHSNIEENDNDMEVESLDSILTGDT